MRNIIAMALILLFLPIQVLSAPENCKTAELNNCLKYGGGSACYRKHCSQAPANPTQPAPTNPVEPKLDDCLKRLDNINSTRGGACEVNSKPGQVRNLNFVKTGGPIIESNSPEQVMGTGWLFRHDTVDSKRGGANKPLSGCVKLYLFHMNKSGKTINMNIAVKGANGNNGNVKISGSMHTNGWFKPLGKGSGPSYDVAKDALTGRSNTSTSKKVNDKGYTVLASARMGTDIMVDGRVEICSDKPFYVATVTTDKSGDSALNSAMSRPAAGNVIPVRSNSYGRVAAIFNQSEIKGRVDINTSTYPRDAMWHINTTSKLDRNLQDQTFQCSMNLKDSSCQSNGNYGRKYNVGVNLNNDTGNCRIYDLYFASNYRSNRDTPSFTWNCPMKINGELQGVYTTPTQPSHKLGSYRVDARTKKSLNLEFIPCGLITAKQHLRVKEIPCQ